MSDNPRKATNITPRVSIITPTFNRAHLLKRLWASLAQQTIQAFEWIIVDDGSTDHTANVIEALNDNRITYIHQRNQGVNAARTRGEKEAKSPAIIFFDSDDEFYGNDALSVMLEEIESSSPEIGAAYFGVIDSKTTQPRYHMHGERIIADYIDHISEAKFHGEFLAIFKREALMLASWPNDINGMECLRHWEIARHRKTLMINRPTRVYHTDSGDNLTGAKSAIRRAASMAIATERLIEAHQSAWQKHCPQQLGRYSFYLAMYRSLSGTGNPLPAILWALRSGEIKVKSKACTLALTLLMTLPIRQKLFTCRAKRQ